MASSAPHRGSFAFLRCGNPPGGSVAHARNRIVTSPDMKARALALRASGMHVRDVCTQVGLGSSTFHRIRTDVGTERFDSILGELRHLLARGAGQAEVVRRAKQLLLGDETTREAAEANEPPLTFDAIAAIGMKLFASKAENARGETRERFLRLASPDYWPDARVSIAAFLSCEPDALDRIAAPQILRATWVVCRNVEGVAP